MMINTSTFSKGLIIFLVYYLEITLVSSDNAGNTDIHIERTIEVQETLRDLINKENGDRKFKINLKTIQNRDSFAQRQGNKVIPSIQLGIRDELLNAKPYPPFKAKPNLNDMYLKSMINYDNLDTRTLQKFNFYAYAPHIFDSLRNIFGINKYKYVSSLCDNPLTGLQNPGASSSQLYFSEDKQFIVKTTQFGEDSCLLNLISNYHVHWGKYVTSLLPKFSGYYGVSLNLFSVFKVVTMNNLLPSNIQIHQKFDLKGSTLGRNASKDEKGKTLPTYKDLDFKEMYPSGILLEKEIYSNLLQILINDCNLLVDLEIMDYSLLMGIFNIDNYLETNANNDLSAAAIKKWENAVEKATKNIINIADDYENEYDVSFRGCIPAKNQKGNRILLFVGIIDVLQTYQLLKNLEHMAKSLSFILNPSFKEKREAISVQPSDFYGKRFIKFMRDFVFTTSYSPPSNTASNDDESANTSCIKSLC